jgi:hypothetical protein
MSALYELWFRSEYQDDLTRQKIFAAVRPGDRRAPLSKGTAVGEVARVKIIVMPGSEERNIQPIFNDFEGYVKITKLVVRTIAELTDEDLRSCSRDARDRIAVMEHLRNIYHRHFSNHDRVTIVHWEYLRKDHS